MREIFVRLAQHIFIDCAHKQFPEYDVYYNWIDVEIHSFGLPEPVIFTWLKDEARDNAIADLNKFPTPNIKELFVPSNYDEYEIEYVDPDPDLFTREYAHWLHLQD